MRIISREEQRTKNEELLNIDPPTYIHINKFLPQPCKYINDPKLFDCQIIYKNYVYNQNRIRIGRCDVCKHYITPQGQALDPKTRNIAGTVYRLNQEK